MPGTFATDQVLIRGAESTTEFTLVGLSVFKISLTDDLRIEGTNAFGFSSTVQPNSCWELMVTPSTNLDLSGRAVFVADIVSGGTGYSVSDTLTISGGTGTAATLTVASVSGGVITSVTIATRGHYTVDPSNPVSVTGGTGGSATFNLELSSYHIFNWYHNLAWGAAATKAFGGLGYSVTSDTLPTRGIIGVLSIAAAGSGYTATDTLTVSGGTFTVACTLTVNTVDGGGGVTSVSIAGNGTYTVEPGMPASVTGGTGSSATFNLIMGLTNSKQWHLAGSDTDTTAGWVRYVIDLNGTPDYSMGSDPTASLDRMGVRSRNNGTLTNKQMGFVVDASSYGTGILITVGTSGAPVTLADIFTYDSNSTRAWGVITQQNNIYTVSGKLRFGTSTQSAVTYFADTSQVIVFPNMPVAADFYEITLRGASGFTTTFKLGTYSGGLASGGCVIRGGGITSSTSHGIWTLTANRSNTVCLLYGSTFSEMRSATLASNSEVRFCTLTNSGATTSNGAVIDNYTFQDLKTGAPISATNALVVASSTEMDNVTNSNFINAARAVKITATGTYAFDNLTFSGNSYDIENSANATTADSYSEANQNATQALGNGTIVGIAQSFTNASSAVLSNARFYLSKTLVPTGTATAKLYAIGSAIGGGDDIPTGTALATSQTVNVANLTGALTLTQFPFTDQYTLAASTDYVITLEYSGGDSTNYVNVGTDTSAPTHTGNFATKTGSTWSAVSGTDGIFYVSRAGVVIVNANNGSDPATFTATGSPPGTVVIVNSVTVTVTILDQAGDPIPGVEVVIFQDIPARTVVLASTATDGSGQVATSATASLGAIIIRARQSTTKATFATSQAFTSEVITTDANHNFRDGDAVVYSKNGGTASIGLTAGTTYYVNNISATTLSLHPTAANALPDTSRIDLTTNGSETHHLDPTRYVAGSATGTIGSGNFSTQITLITDNIATG